MTLYHYTTAAGLQGIIASNSLWTSDYRFLNDTTEFQYGWRIVLEAIDRRGAQLKNASTIAWDTIELFRQHPDKVYAFVGSLTSEGDLLSQWRGYNHGKGFSIGFNEDWLRENATAQGFEIIPVVYDGERQRANADRVVEMFLDDLSDSTDVPERAFDNVRTVWMHFLRVALGFKNQHFREECESRLVWVGTSWPPGLRTRTSLAGLVPYRACQFNKAVPRGSILHPQNHGIEEIIVGPALAEQQVSAVEALLASHHMRLPIKKSAIPYVAD